MQTHALSLGEGVPYEGLVIRTAEMFYRRVGLELEDMLQELRLKVLKAVKSYDSSRTRMSERAWVYACLVNFVKDLKRDAARRVGAPLTVSHMEDYRGSEDPSAMGRDGGMDWFEFQFCHATREQVYGYIDNPFLMPVTITDREREVILLLVMGFDQTSIARELGVGRVTVARRVARIREKLGDWRPTAAPDVAPAPSPGQQVAA